MPPEQAQFWLMVLSGVGITNILAVVAGYVRLTEAVKRTAELQDTQWKKHDSLDGEHTRLREDFIDFRATIRTRLEDLTGRVADHNTANAVNAIANLHGLLKETLLPTMERLETAVLRLDAKN